MKKSKKSKFKPTVVTKLYTSVISEITTTHFNLSEGEVVRVSSREIIILSEFGF